MWLIFQPVKDKAKIFLFEDVNWLRDHDVINKDTAWRCLFCDKLISEHGLGNVRDFAFTKN